ncbi:CIA30 family protein [Lutimonas halocynthiae]|uniref:CIA30 family protein n=1 Tax=Lutimonas halocynthiae TaxID=1446477 RepID=UPI0025B2F5A9|nr:CIA30 family protein [Lutimonas halocynthiae]MDN3644057.1 CIA30 family protein [Lutimonas halocynthiae]
MTNSMEAQDYLFNFSNDDAEKGWLIVNDGVMGGLSKGRFEVIDHKAVFSGKVSTDNNGGFTMIRNQFKQKSLLSYKSFILELKGDGKTYQFRVKSSTDQRHSYVYTFTTNGKWQKITIPFASLEPRFRGRDVNVSNFEGLKIEEVAFLIGNKREESFELIVKEISLK